MVSVIIDSNVLLDIMTEDAGWFAWSAEAVEKAAERFRLVVNPIIYVEVSVRYCGNGAPESHVRLQTGSV
ncbi:MAG TPA: hypothetical protein VFW75_08565 [Acetobacteraceae bacterium]|nr:hypothetical protein [Acetobacteraceae bacterium]